MAKKGQRLELTLQRQARAWQMRIDGFTQREIAYELGIKQQSVCALLKRTREEYHAEFMEDLDYLQQEQVMSIMRAAKDALDSWNRSKACGPGPDAQYNQFGDTKYMKIYILCLAEIRKILGTEEAFNFKMDIDINSLSDDELNQIINSKNPSTLKHIAALQKR